MANRHYSETVYLKIADNYDETRWQQKNGRFIDAIQKELLYKILLECDIQNGNKVLDVGAGTGRFVLEFAENGYYTHGIDISEKMLQKAKNKGDQLSNLYLEKGDAKHLPFPCNYFDFVTSYRTMIHIPDYEKAIEEIYRVLKPGGYTLLEFNNKYSLSGLGKLLRQLRKIFGMHLEIDPHVSSSFELHNLFSNVGFEIKKIYHQFFMSELVYRYSPKQTLKLLKYIDRILCSSVLGYFTTRYIVLARKSFALKDCELANNRDEGW